MRLVLAVTIALLIALAIAVGKFTAEQRDRERSRQYRESAVVQNEPVVSSDVSSVSNAQVLVAILRFDTATMAKMDNDQLFGFIVVGIILLSMLFSAIGSIIDDLGIFLQRVIHGKKR